MHLQHAQTHLEYNNLSFPMMISHNIYSFIIFNWNIIILYISGAWCVFNEYLFSYVSCIFSFAFIYVRAPCTCSIGRYQKKILNPRSLWPARELNQLLYKRQIVLLISEPNIPPYNEIFLRGTWVQYAMNKLEKLASESSQIFIIPLHHQYTLFWSFWNSK